MALAQITFPIEYDVLDKSVAITVLATSAEDTSLTLYIDGVSQGSMTSLGSGNFSKSYTPSALAQSVSLHVVGDNTGACPAIIVSVDDANLISQNITTWTKNPVSLVYSSGHSDPFGGTAAYRVALPTGNTGGNISYTSGSNPVETLCGEDFWLKPYGDMNVIYVASTVASAKGVYINLLTGEAKSLGIYGAVINRLSNGWVRVRVARAAPSDTYITNPFYLYFARAIGSITYTAITSGEAASGIGMYIFQPRMIGSIKPYLTSRHKLAVYRDNTTAKVEQWNFRHPDINIPDDMLGGSLYHDAMCFRVQKPDSWVDGIPYPVVYFLPPLTDDLQHGFGDHTTAWENIRDGDYANTYNTVYISIYLRNTNETFGVLPDGTQDNRSFTEDLMTQFAIEYCSASADPRHHSLCGYSATAVTALSLLMKAPHRFGRALVWDPPTSDIANPAPGYIASVAAQYGTYDNWLLYDPSVILPTEKASYNKFRRFAIWGGTLFTTNYTRLVNQLNSENVQFHQRYNQEAVHGWGPTTWFPYAMAQLDSMVREVGTDGTSLDSIV